MRLTRRELRKIILESVNEEKSAASVLKKALTKTSDHYVSVFEKEGIVGGFKEMVIDLPVKAAIAAAKIISDEKIRADLENKLNTDGAAAAYEMYMDMLHKELGIPLE
jgi:hypothetical protein